MAAIPQSSFTMIICYLKEGKGDDLRGSGQILNSHHL